MSARTISACTIRSPVLFLSCLPLPTPLGLAPQLPDIRHRHQVPNHHPSAHHPFAPFSNLVIFKNCHPERAAFAREGSRRAARRLASCARQQPRVWPASIVGSSSATFPPFPQNTKGPSDVQVRGGPVPPSRLYKNHPQYRKSKSS